MDRPFWLFPCTCLIFALMGWSSAACAFDIAVYCDARSGVNWRSQNPSHSFCGSTDRATVLTRIENQQDVFDWFNEMGVNYIIPYYPFADDFTALQQWQLHGMKILNFSYPQEAFKYLEAQYRDLFPGQLSDQYVNDDGSSWGQGATDVVDSVLGARVLQISAPYLAQCGDHNPI